MGPARRAIWRVVALTLPLLLVLLFRVPQAGIAVRLWLIAMGGVGLVILAELALSGRRVHDVEALSLRWGWWHRSQSASVRPLEELERAVDFSLATAFDVHYRLRPRLRRIAEHRLAKHGARLEGERAEALLGADAWDLVRPDRPEPADRAAPGLDLARLRRVVEALDAL